MGLVLFGRIPRHIRKLHQGTDLPNFNHKLGLVSVSRLLRSSGRPRRLESAWDDQEKAV